MSTTTIASPALLPDEDDLLYRRAEAEDVPKIAALITAGGLYWPGAAATPYIAQNSVGEIVGVLFKTLCFHAEPFCVAPGAQVSVSALGRVMREDMQALADFTGQSVTVYTSVKNTPRALEAARKNGLRATEYIPHEIVVEPSLAAPVTATPVKE